jgi:hypothetical protein
MPDDFVVLTKEQDEFWEGAFAQYVQRLEKPSVAGRVQASRRADADLVARWPELTQYEFWTSPGGANPSLLVFMAALFQKVLTYCPGLKRLLSVPKPHLIQTDHAQRYERPFR